MTHRNSPTAPGAPSRRTFLKGAGALAGSLAGTLIVGFHLPAAAGLLPRTGLPGGTVVNAWLRIGPDGFVTIFTNVSEIGQGTASGHAQVLAEELEVEWKHIAIEMAPVEEAYFNTAIRQYAVWGSTGMRTRFEALRKVGAQARTMLIQAAADRWGLPADACTARNGVVHHDPSERRAGYGDLAAAAALLTPPADPPLKPRANWTVIGRAMPRLDLPAKVDGSAVYGVDVAVPGMRIATIRQAPVHGGRLAGVDPAPALAVRGVERVVTLADAVAVIATGYWPARKGLEALNPDWDLSATERLDDTAIRQRLEAALDSGAAKTFARRGQDASALEAATAAGLAAAAETVVRSYAVPFQHHAALEPMNGTARMTAEGGVELWLPTQNQSQAKVAIAEALGIPRDKVLIHTTLIGGGFGRRIEVDYGVQAALIAREAGVPVKLIWSREEDTAHGFYRPAAIGRLTAGLDAKGGLTAVVFEAAAPSLMDYSILGRANPGQPPDPVEFTGVMYASNLPYGFPAYRPAYAKTNVGVRCGFWRSVGDSQNAFFIESFLDELAEKAGADPVAWRRPLLAQAPRELGVLDAVAAASRWDTAPPPGVFRGVAMSRSNGSSSAAVVEVGLAGKALTLRHVWVAIDVGIAVNPDSIRQQVEGGVAFGLTAALHGKITVADGAVQQTNFHDFPLLTLAEMPPVTVIIRETGDRMGGVGEEAVAAMAPALANALYRATGTRHRTLPLADHGFTIG